ncbi:hypothetical protein A3L12_01645 [Thermococcus sp. P6]|uniref:hypothetical protein n=1 Tax=Thermococcus sp. P6 TaxID=122420 RepID=UPI000B598B9D|nr:hypothetical protein [Thermococcus sp. P6]ASJ10089.1 hypothetical protein A3L12_01645 [Thermococcus sp. P6]
MKGRIAITGALLMITLLLSGCISGGGGPTGTSTESPAKNLPFTKEKLEDVASRIESYRYVMDVKTYNGTELVATLHSTVSVDKKNGERASSTIGERIPVNGTGRLLYAVYYYTNKLGSVTLTNRSGLVSWEFSCNGADNRSTGSTLLDNLWKDFPLENATLTTEGDYYLLTVNRTLWNEGNGKDYDGTVTVKLTGDLVPVEIVQKAYYERDGERWVDEVRVEIEEINSTSVTPPRPLVDYLKEKGFTLEELFDGC